MKKINDVIIKVNKIKNIIKIFSDKLNEIYKLVKIRKLNVAEKKYNHIKRDIKFVMKDIPTFICYGKRVFAYRMGLKNIYDRKPYLLSLIHI